MKYVYYDPATNQVEAEFDTPELAIQANWAARGFLRAVVPAGLTVTRDHKISSIVGEDILSVGFASNPSQPLERETSELEAIRDRMKAGTADVADLLRERQINLGN